MDSRAIAEPGETLAGGHRDVRSLSVKGGAERGSLVNGSGLDLMCYKNIKRGNYVLWRSEERWCHSAPMLRHPFP